MDNHRKRLYNNRMEGNMSYHQIVRSGVIIALCITSSLWALASTSGTPLGGFGTGYMVYNAKNGNFAAVSKVMPAASLGSSEFNSYQSSSCGFHFYANGTSKQKATTTNEDAKCPVYNADFGTTGGVGFKLTAFGPFIPGSSTLYDQLAHSPLACFDVTATNASTTAAATVAVALEFSNQSSGGTNLLGGANAGASDGTNAITWAGDTTAGNAYMIVNCDNTSATYSAGAIGSFLTNGTLTAGAGNLASASCSIPAGGTAHFKFIMSWWQRWVNPGGHKSPGGAEDHWYHNFYANSKACATFGMGHFDQIEAGATSIVNRVMACNFPDWYKDRLLNNLYPMTHNSVVAKDGRTGFWEGAYPIIGTLDQGEHAALWYVFNWPQNQWHELQYWARQSHKAAEGALLGQVHHDFNGCTTGGWSYSATDSTHFVYPWDNSTHVDYWYQPNTTDWSDLNSMFIFKAYELMLATANRDSVNKYWPNVKNTIGRIIVQCGTAHLPGDNTKSTYDDGSSTPVYASGVALATYQAVAEIGKWLGDDSTATRLTNWYNLARAEFAPRFFNTSFATGQAKSEGDVAGYSWARYFCFPAIFDSAVITTGCNRLWTYYNAQGSERAKLGQWHFYTYDHWGGADIAIGKQDTAMLMSQWDYDYEYTQSPANVFWQDLNSTNTSYASYMTAPCVWRGMFQMTGYLLDNANNRLWIRPMVPTSMAKKITNAPLINPNGWGTLNYDENPVVSTGRFQNITVTFDSLVTIKQIVLKNNTGVSTPGVSVTNNGTLITGTTVAAEGSGYEKNIRVTLTSPIQIGPQGLGIQVFNAPVNVDVAIASRMPAILACGNSRICAGKSIRYTIDIAGPVSMDLIGLNGVKIATIMKGTAAAGQHSFVWNGMSRDGVRISAGVGVIRLSSQNGAVSKVVMIGQ